MEIKKQNIHMNYEKASAMSQITLDDDYNLPDYRPDIVKVLKEKGEIRFDEIQVKEGRIYVKGNLIFHVLYRSDMEEHKLDCLRGQIPFEETISMDGVNELDPVDVTAELEDINIGIINSRKLSVRALVMLKAEMRMRKETELITGVAMEHPLEILQNRHNILELETCKKDNYRLKQERCRTDFMEKCAASGCGNEVTRRKNPAYRRNKAVFALLCPERRTPVRMVRRDDTTERRTCLRGMQ